MKPYFSNEKCLILLYTWKKQEVTGPTKLDMTKNPFIVSASDGVWEFIDSKIHLIFETLTIFVISLIFVLFVIFAICVIPVILVKFVSQYSCYS